MNLNFKSLIKFKETSNLFLQMFLDAKLFILLQVIEYYYFFLSLKGKRWCLY